MKATISLTPSESKRLIARSIAELAEVQEALSDGTIIIANGTTNSYVAEELTGTPIDNKVLFAAGIITKSGLDRVPDEKRMKPVVIRRGEVIDVPWQDALKEMKRGDIFIKGANAIDVEGNAGVLMASDRGGTVGAALGTVTARGIPIIIPCGLEKLIPSVQLAAQQLGMYEIDHSTGDAVGMMCISHGIVIHEIEAMEIMYDVVCTHVASGGIDGAEGSVVICADGPGDEIKQLMDTIEQIKGETGLVCS